MVSIKRKLLAKNYHLVYQILFSSIAITIWDFLRNYINIQFKHTKHDKSAIEKTYLASYTLQVSVEY